MKLAPVVRILALGVTLSVAAWSAGATAEIAASADVATEDNVQRTDELHLAGLTKSAGGFVIFVAHQRDKPKPLTEIGAAIGPFELRAVDARRGFADFAREGTIYRIWLAESEVKHGRAPPPPPDYAPPSVRVAGAVHRPGLVVHYQDMPITAALEMAGAPKKEADLKRVKLLRRVRRTLTTREIDVASLLAHPDQPVVTLERGDVVEVPLLDPPRPAPSPAALAFIDRLAISRAHPGADVSEPGMLFARMDGRARAFSVGHVVDEQLGIKVRAIEADAAGVKIVFEEKSGALLSRNLPASVQPAKAGNSSPATTTPRP